MKKKAFTYNNNSNSIIDDHYSQDGIIKKCIAIKLGILSISITSQMITLDLKKRALHSAARKQPSPSP